MAENLIEIAAVFLKHLDGIRATRIVLVENFLRVPAADAKDFSEATFRNAAFPIIFENSFQEKVAPDDVGRVAEVPGNAIRNVQRNDHALAYTGFEMGAATATFTEEFIHTRHGVVEPSPESNCANIFKLYHTVNPDY
jgi:hypothetical protein